jgi:CarD family transcriptional regulator
MESKMTTRPQTVPEAAFTPGEAVVYPGHGVGTVTSIETQAVAGQKIMLFVVNFAQDRMTLRVPLHKAKASGLRKISTPREMASALATLKSPATTKKIIWNRRAVEYTAKINSGNLTSIAEVVRDLYRPGVNPERSHSERLLYEQAMVRLTHEVAAVDKIEIDAATAKLERLLAA